MNKVINKEDIVVREFLISPEDKINAMFSLGADIASSCAYSKDFGLMCTRKFILDKDLVRKIV